MNMMNNNLLMADKGILEAGSWEVAGEGEAKDLRPKKRERYTGRRAGMILRID